MRVTAVQPSTWPQTYPDRYCCTHCRSTFDMPAVQFIAHSRAHLSGVAA